MGSCWCIDLHYIRWAVLLYSSLCSAVLLVVHLRWNVSPWSLFKKCISEHHKMHMQYKTRGENVLHHTDFQKQHILGCYSLHFLSLIFGSCSIFSQRCFCFLRSIPTTPANVFPTTFLKEVLWGFPIRKQPYLVNWWDRGSLNPLLGGLWAKLLLLLLL